MEKQEFVEPTIVTYDAVELIENMTAWARISIVES